MSGTAEIPLMRKALGGLIAGRAYLVQGRIGAGKTVLGIQAAQAWLSASLPVVYLTSDRAQDLLEQAEDLGLSLTEGWRAGRLALAETLPAAGAQLARRGAAALLARIDAIRPPGAAALLVVDELGPFLRGSGRPEQRARAVRQLLEGLRGRGLATLLHLEGGLWRQPALARVLREGCWARLTLRRVQRRRSAPGSAGRAAGELLLEIDRPRTAPGSEQRIACAVVKGAGLLPVAEAAARRGDGRGRPDGVRVLLASSEADLFLPLAGLLRRTAEVEVVTDGVEALSRAVTWAPSAILAETELPRLSGFAVVRTLRQGHYGMPVVLVSRAMRRHSERVRAYLNGASDFVFFPFDLSDMVYRLHVACQMSVHTFQDGSAEHELEGLVERAQSHVLDLGAFQRAVALSLTSGMRFSSPISLVTFGLRGSPTAEPAPVWDDLCRTLDEKLRAADLVCYPAEGRIAVLLCHETRRGAEAFVRRMQGLLAARASSAYLDPAPWRIEVDIRTLHLPEDQRVDVAQVMASAFSKPRLFLSSEGTEAEAEVRPPEADGRRWGT
jgi:CheY-like chemotaxis protein/archaellum biogenesis ATPase FlaH